MHCAALQTKSRLLWEKLEGSRGNYATCGSIAAEILSLACGICSFSIGLDRRPPSCQYEYSRIGSWDGPGALQSLLKLWKSSLDNTGLGRRRWKWCRCCAPLGTGSSVFYLWPCLWPVRLCFSALKLSCPSLDAFLPGLNRHLCPVNTDPNYNCGPPELLYLPETTVCDWILAFDRLI